MIQVPYKNTVGKDYYAYWENFLTDEDMNFLLHHPSWDAQQDALVGQTNDGGSVNKDIRRTKVGWLNFDQQNLHIWDKVSRVFAEVNSRFFHAHVTGCYEYMQMTAYYGQENGKYDWHMDMCPQDTLIPRKLAMVLMLSDSSEYEGGEFQIKVGEKNEVLETKKGRAWFMPSYILHRVTPVTKGVRKTAVVWAGGDQWK